MKLFVLMVVLLIFVSGGVKAECVASIDRVVLAKKIVALHVLKSSKYPVVFWYECSKRLSRKSVYIRAFQYSNAILASAKKVCVKTGVNIDPEYVAAILFRETANNECSVGNQEKARILLNTSKQKMNRRSLLKYVEDFFSARKKARRWCLQNKKSLKNKNKFDLLSCNNAYLKVHYPEYLNVKGFDVGVAQYRVLHSTVLRRVVLPDDTVFEKVYVKNLFDYRVSIQMLVEDLASFKISCKRHRHKDTHKKYGRNSPVLDSDDVYFVHHHSGSVNWSFKYWNAINRHLSVMRSSSENIGKVLLSLGFETGGL